MKYFVDYGHGGADSGAVGVNSVLEKNINLLIGERVTYHLRRHGQTVIETRKGDTNPSLQERVNIINSEGCDLGISIHCNASKYIDARGVEIFTWGVGARERELADTVLNQIIKDKLYSVNRGVKHEQWHILSPQIPCVLFETGFITNESDKNLIMNNIENIAVSLTKGLLNYYGITYKKEQSNEVAHIKYTVQVGAYSQRVNAENMLKQLDKYGIIGIIKEL